jgi:hypothetical protein
LLHLVYPHDNFYFIFSRCKTRTCLFWREFYLSQYQLIFILMSEKTKMGLIWVERKTCVSSASSWHTPRGMHTPGWESLIYIYQFWSLQELFEVLFLEFDVTWMKKVNCLSLSIYLTPIWIFNQYSIKNRQHQKDLF